MTINKYEERFEKLENRINSLKDLINQELAHHLFLAYIKLFQKTQRDLELVSLFHFLHDL